MQKKNTIIVKIDIMLFLISYISIGKVLLLLLFFSLIFFHNSHAMKLRKSYSKSVYKVVKVGASSSAALDRRGGRGDGDEEDARAPCVLPKLFGARCTIDFSHPMRKILRGGAGEARREEGEEGAQRQGGRWSAAGRCNARRRPGRRADSRTATPL